MALTGTLEDFGIADILQLIGQQQKTGVLHLKAKDRVVQIHFVDGNVVKAESANRSRKDLLGSMMVRAGVLEEKQLDHALDQQRRTLRRLGDILVDEGYVTRELFREMYQLQTTETLYKLFHWKDGTYEFEQQEVDWDREAISPIRSENALMEGFRMVDEWPMIRKRITSYEMTFRRLKVLGPGSMVGSGPATDDLDAAFDALGGEAPQKPGEFASIGDQEKRLFSLADEDVTVQTIIDRSRLGEFETCKSLLGLVNAGFLEPVAPARKRGQPIGGGERRDLLGAVRRGLAHVGVGLAVLAGVGLLAYAALGTGGAPGGRYTPRGGLDLLAGDQLARLHNALTIYRLEKGRVPESLGELTDVGLVTESDLSYPYGRVYYYRPDPDGAQGYVLLPPIP